jgi:hypothetical protein
MKRNLIWLAASVAALGAGVAGAQTYQGQPGYGYGHDDSYRQAQTVRCESIGSRRATCRIDRASDVRLARQLSRQQCVRGRNWDYTDSQIRVTEGCRADFLVTRRDDRWNDDRYGNGNGHGQGQMLRCESRSQRGRTYCGNDYGQYSMMGYGNRSCVEGRTWGRHDRGVWVSGNCNAQFRFLHQGDDDRGRYGRGESDRYDRDERGQPVYGETIRCDSNSSGRTYCTQARDGRYTLRQNSNPNCIEGRTFGTDSRGLWVSGACSARFERVTYNDDPRNDGYQYD